MPFSLVLVAALCKLHCTQASSNLPCVARILTVQLGMSAASMVCSSESMSCAVDGGERAVMYDRIQGVLPVAVMEGTHFRIPWLQSPAVMDIRTRPRSISSVTGTKGARLTDHLQTQQLVQSMALI